MQILLQLLYGAMIACMCIIVKTLGNEHFRTVHFWGYVNHISVKKFSKHQLAVLSVFFFFILTCKMGIVVKIK